MFHSMKHDIVAQNDPFNVMETCEPFPLIHKT